MAVVIRDKKSTSTQYSFIKSNVDGLISALLFGNAAVSDALRFSVLNGQTIIGQLTAKNSSGVTLQASGGVSLGLASSGTTVGRLEFPYSPTNQGEACLTIVSALNTPTFVQIGTYAGYRIGINGTGGIEIVDSTDANTVATASIGLLDLGYMSSTQGLKGFVITTELRTIADSGLRLTATLHNAAGDLLATAYQGIGGVSLDLSLTPTPYVGGAKAASTTGSTKTSLHYGHFIYYRQLTDEEKSQAASQLAGYANAIGANIS